MVRDATASDIPVLVGFVVEEAREAQALVLDPAQVTASVSAMFADPALGRYWVVEQGGAIAGAIAVVREWSDWRNAAYWWIQFVYVRPEVRGRGLVEELIGHVRALASAAPEVRLYVHHDNARAIRAYERLGFRALPYRIMAIDPAPALAPAIAELDDDALWRGFHDRTLSHAQWTHTAHVRIAWMHLARYGIDEAHLRMRVGIIRLNAAHGLVETPQRGYHETITRVWLVLVEAARRREAGTDSRVFVATHALGRDAPLRHYSRERLFSLEARTTYVEPDLAPLP
jgi:ribosomal protein S18 acetylase RimI-like enzyme